MAKIIIWRTDRRKFCRGDKIGSRGDHIQNIDPTHTDAENLLRKCMEDGINIRGKSLYTWKDESWARKSWTYQKDHYFYKLKADVGDILHQGDVAYYTDIGCALKNGECPQSAISLYISSDVSILKPYVEILLKVATVLQRFDPPPK